MVASPLHSARGFLQGSDPDFGFAKGGGMRRLVIAAAAALVAAPAAAQQKIDFILNWVPGGDHAPYYYAKKLGWYQKEGIDLNLEPGKGSALATQKVGAGANPVGLADMGGVLWRRAKARTRWRCSMSTPTRRRA